jgi:16S rRNA (guanine527-N7)-methyltransferase
VPAALPEIPAEEFARRLRELAPGPLGDEAVAALHAHYQELRRWSPRLALIGPGTAGEVLARHYGESLAALPLLAPPSADAGALVDLGSGAGFPGFVLAAARPDLDAVLVEARARKWAFLLAAARRAALPVRCLNARVQLPLPRELPERIGCVTTRALRLPAPVLAALAERLVAGGRILLWAGAEAPELPPGLEVRGSVRLAGSADRRILEVRPARERGAGR